MECVVPACRAMEPWQANGFDGAAGDLSLKRLKWLRKGCSCAKCNSFVKYPLRLRLSFTHHSASSPHPLSTNRQISSEHHLFWGHYCLTTFIYLPSTSYPNSINGKHTSADPSGGNR